MSVLQQTPENPHPDDPLPTSDQYQDDPPLANQDINAQLQGPPLCSICRRFDIQSFSTPTRTRGFRLRDVDAAAARCEFCTLLSRAVIDVEKPVYYRPPSLTKKGGPVERELYIHMTLSQNYEAVGEGREGPGLGVNRMKIQLGDRFSELRVPSEWELCLAADPLSSAARNGDITGRYLGQNPTSAETFKEIELWVKHCEGHPNCNRTVSGALDSDAQKAPLPSRCIEILDNGSLILRETTDQTQGPYITVTHRWNQQTEKCKTTMDNYQARLSGGGFHDIPKLFEDIKAIARKLGIRLVWIDSLCIIQSGDGSKDWAREAPKMAQYYQHSLVTIAGTMPDTTAGMLRPYPKDATPWGCDLARMPYRDHPGAQRGHFYVYKRQARLVDDYWSSVRGPPLLRRGWILQEWLLSKRLVWYTPNGIFLECRSEAPRTPSGEKMCLEMAGPALRSHLEMKQAFHFTNPRILEFWYRALETYSECSLTKSGEDRIVALAGLAKEVREVLLGWQSRVGIREKGIVYLVGLWLGDIHQGMLWEVNHPQNGSIQRIDQVPTWSWAHVLSRVRWPERIEGAGKAAKGVPLPRFDPRNMFASLHLTGRLYPVHVRVTTKDELELAAQSTAYTNPPRAPCNWRAVCSPTDPEIIAGWGSLESLSDDRYTCADFGVAVHAFHVSTRHVRTGFCNQMCDPVLDVIFLEEVEGGAGYRRLGVGRIADAGLIADFLAVDEEGIQLL